jgi:hypothetical protein
MPAKFENPEETPMENQKKNPPSAEFNEATENFRTALHNQLSRTKSIAAELETTLRSLQHNSDSISVKCCTEFGGQIGGLKSATQKMQEAWAAYDQAVVKERGLEHSAAADKQGAQQQHEHAGAGR